ncbi:hypothetical protein KDK95_00235 [Actinospica sp. MGRD01-02]|uniref:Uncharacterized protein n=1 Tax=Actinospica acidithermotolerans TaxID=2828514 RepID=A0A941E694_9ACTN|nr:hypothetical protein [Actinospica acidithermotolerans]MBR7824718.1 hypothetical protein [Actinospica acidithermotolerans]
MGDSLRKRQRAAAVAFAVSVMGLVPAAAHATASTTAGGTMYHDVRNANGTWQPQGWGIPGGSTGFQHVSETAMPDGSTQFVGVTSSGVLEHNIRSATGAWQGWDALNQPGVTVTNADIAGMPNGSAQIVEETTTGAVWHNIRNADGSWQSHGWGLIADPYIVSDAKITGMPDGSSELIGVYGGVLKHNIRFANGSWQGWKVVAVDVISRDVYFTSADIAGMPDGSAQIVAITPSTTVPAYHSIRYANGSWQPQGFASIGAPVSSTAISITAMPDGSSQFVDVVPVGNSTKIYHDVRNANGSWQQQGWAQLPTPNSTVPVASADIAGMPNGSSQLIALTQS